jgi:hypothetical protein
MSLRACGTQQTTARCEHGNDVKPNTTHSVHRQSLSYNYRSRRYTDRANTITPFRPGQTTCNVDAGEAGAATVRIAARV